MRRNRTPWRPAFVRGPCVEPPAAAASHGARCAGGRSHRIGRGGVRGVVLRRHDPARPGGHVAKGCRSATVTETSAPAWTPRSPAARLVGTPDGGVPASGEAVCGPSAAAHANGYDLSLRVTESRREGALHRNGAHGRRSRQAPALVDTHLQFHLGKTGGETQ